MTDQAIANRILSEFQGTPDFPYPGFNFLDITPVLEHDPEGTQWILRQLRDKTVRKPDYVVCIESFGYIFGAPLAETWGAGIVLARKSGKLPRETVRSDYSMVYSSRGQIEIHKDAMQSGKTAVIVDDVLATGGTAGAVVSLVRSLGCVVDAVLVAVEIGGLNARRRLESQQVPVIAALKMEFDVAQHNSLTSTAP